MSKWDFIKNILKNNSQSIKEDLRKVFNDATSSPNFMEKVRSNLDTSYSRYKRKYPDTDDIYNNAETVRDLTYPEEKYLDPYDYGELITTPEEKVADIYKLYQNYGRNKKFLNKKTTQAYDDVYNDYLKAVLLGRKMGKTSKEAAGDYLSYIERLKNPDEWDHFGGVTFENLMQTLDEIE